MLLLEWAFKTPSILSDHAEKHWSLFSPESSVSKVSLGYKKKPPKNKQKQKKPAKQKKILKEVGMEKKEYGTPIVLSEIFPTYGQATTLCWPVQKDHWAFNELVTVPHIDILESLFRHKQMGMHAC